MIGIPAVTDLCGLPLNRDTVDELLENPVECHWVGVVVDATDGTPHDLICGPTHGR